LNRLHLAAGRGHLNAPSPARRTSPPSSSLERDFCRRRQTRQNGTGGDISAQRLEIRDHLTREMAAKNGLSASELSVAGFGRLGGGRTRARTWDPLVTWLGPISRRPVSEEHRLFRVRVERSDSGHLTRTGPDGGGEALLRLREFLPVVRVEAVSAVAGAVHHDLDCHDRSSI